MLVTEIIEPLKCEIARKFLWQYLYSVLVNTLENRICWHVLVEHVCMIGIIEEQTLI